MQAERAQHEEQPRHLEEPHEQRQGTRDRQCAKAVEHAFTEEPADPAHLARKEARDPRAEGVERSESQEDDDAEAGARDVEDVQVGEHGAAESDVAVHHQEPKDDEEVQEALRDDDPDRPRERDPETALHQVAAIEVAELGGDQAVDEPAEHQDAEEIATLDVVAALPEEPCPANGPDGERQVVHTERGEHVQRIRPAERRDRLAPVDVPREEGDERDRDDRGHELPPAEELPPYGELVGVPGDFGESLDARIFDVRAVPLRQRLAVELFRPSHFRKRS